PIVIPKHDVPFVSCLNNFLMKIYVRVLGRIFLGPGPIIYWTYNHLSVDFLRSDHVIYHCVDDISAAPGMHIERIKVKEEELVNKAKITFVTSLSLQDKLQKIKKDTVHYFPNVAEISHFSKALGNLKRPKDLENFKGPVL